MYQGKFNKTKIVATIGPATSSVEMLEKIILAGVDVCRLNFSHGTYEQHQEVINNIRTVNEKLGANIAILQDLQGPKLRIGKVDGEIHLIEDQFILVTTEEQISTSEILFVSYKRLVKDCKPGERILLNDGKVSLEFVEKINDTTLKAKVIAGGPLSSNKGFNLPDSNLTVPSLTKKDLADLDYGLSQEMDWVALSFVRSADDIIELKRLIALKGTHTKVIAKIEKPEAVANIDEIIKVSDGIMVARGDLGVEVPMQRVPLIQKTIVEKCLAAAKPCIIATQMMESMISNLTPSRAEVNDVANAVMDGADAVMLSAETSVGKFPIKVVEIMRKIITEVEELDSIYYKENTPQIKTITYITDSICFNACSLAHHAGANAIISLTNSGYTAFKLSSHRPKAPIFIFTDNLSLLTTLNLVWGVRGYYYDKYESTDHTIDDLKDIIKSKGLLKKDDLVINIASMPMKEKGRTNMMKLSYIS